MLLITSAECMQADMGIHWCVNRVCISHTIVGKSAVNVRSLAKSEGMGMVVLDNLEANDLSYIAECGELEKLLELCYKLGSGIGGGCDQCHVINMNTLGLGWVVERTG